MHETAKTEEQKSTPGENAVTLYTDSTALSKNCEMEVLQSTNLLINTTQHLHGLMKSLTANRAPADLKEVEPEKVNAACNCANQIYKIARLQLDAFNLHNNIQNTK